MYLIPIYWFVALTPIVVFTITFLVVRRMGKSKPESIQIGCCWFFLGLLIAVSALQLVPAHWIIP